MKWNSVTVVLFISYIAVGIVCFKVMNNLKETIDTKVKPKQDFISKCKKRGDLVVKIQDYGYYCFDKDFVEKF